MTTMVSKAPISPVWEPGGGWGIQSRSSGGETNEIRKLKGQSKVGTGDGTHPPSRDSSFFVVEKWRRLESNVESNWGAAGKAVRVMRILVELVGKIGRRIELIGLDAK